LQAKTPSLAPLASDGGSEGTAQAVGFAWNEANHRSLHGLCHGMSISEIILVPLPKWLAGSHRLRATFSRKTMAPLESRPTT
jgi:hypothetical protein